MTTTTPTDILDTIVGGTIDAGVTIFSHVVTNYLPYLLVLGVAFALYGAFKKFAHLGSR